MSKNIKTNKQFLLLAGEIYVIIEKLAYNYDRGKASYSDDRDYFDTYEIGKACADIVERIERNKK